MKTNCEDVNMGKNKIKQKHWLRLYQEVNYFSPAISQHINIKSAKRLVSLKDEC